MFFLRHSELQWIVGELRPWAVGARIQKVRRLQTGCLILQSHRPGQAFDLIISLNPHIARLGMSVEKTPSVPADDRSAQWLKSNLRGHRLQDLWVDEHDKIVEILWPNGRLVLELFGAQPRLIGLDSNLVIRCVEPMSTDARLRLGGVYGKVSNNKTASLPHEDAQIRFTSLEDVESAARLRYETMAQSREELLKRKLMKRSHKQLNRLRRKLEADLEKLGHPEEWQRRGELVKSQVWQIERGQTSIKVVDYFDSEMPTIEIELNPEYSGPENVERFFKMYRRSKSGAVHIQRRIEAIDERMIRLMDLPVDTMASETLELELRQLGVRLPRTSSSASARNTDVRRPYLEFKSGKGERILVGRGGIDNHQTSFKVGKGNDHWLHVKDAPGAHVLVPVKRGEQP
ncbi:MAG: NFACT family protein, partial [Bradymonadia bacterium]